ncbi:hypothetical protein [Actinocorallia longicatena]|uniref:EthD domain-containing protein n=1 Tax=Actinocorallia longicatena TaxID=111803 RepID=A0ABP6QAH5_9ACTN
MIRWIRFAGRPDGTPAAEFAAGWPAEVAPAALAPADARPSRLSAATVLPGFDDAPHQAVAIAWFTGEERLRRFLAWWPEDSGSVEIVTAEAVLRGADWLHERWSRGVPKLKHMALARRADGLTPQEFSARWRAHAGTAATGVPIPDTARGLAYVQCRPLVDGAGPYDAVNEAYFDDEESLRHRDAWLRANLPGDDDPLFARPRFLALREQLIPIP